MRDEGPPRMSDDTILQTEDLTKDFAGFVAVNGVNLRVRRGTIHALIGPNGAGKTTCFNLLTKFLSPTRGRILFKGDDITDMEPAAVARLGLVRSFQISAVFPHLSVLENVRIALQRRRHDNFAFWRSDGVLSEHDERARALLGEVGLEAQAAARRSLTPAVNLTAMSAGSFCVEGAPCEITCTSIPAPSISLRRMLPKSLSCFSMSPPLPASIPV